MDKLRKAAVRPMLLRALALYPDIEGVTQLYSVACFVNAELRAAGLSFSVTHPEVATLIEREPRIPDQACHQHESFGPEVTDYLKRAAERQQLQQRYPNERFAAETLCSTRQTCAACSVVLPRPVASKKSAALYARRYSTTAAICISTCSECGAEHGYGWWKRAGEQEHVSTEDDALSLRYLVVTAETIVELAWLREVDADFVAACCSYQESLNGRNSSCGPQHQPRVHEAMVKELGGRWQLELHRFIRAHTLYAFLLDLDRGNLLEKTPLPRFGSTAESELLDLIMTHMPRIEAHSVHAGLHGAWPGPRD